MVSEAHAFFNGMGDGFLLTCLVVVTLCAGFTLLSASSFFGQRRLMAECPCPQFTHLVCDSRCPCTGLTGVVQRITCRSGPRTCRSWPGGQTSGSCSTAVVSLQRVSFGKSSTPW